MTDQNCNGQHEGFCAGAITDEGICQFGQNKNAAKQEFSKVQQLRNKTGRGVQDCRKALDTCGGDLKIADAYMRFANLAVVIKPRDGETPAQARLRWALQRAREASEGI
jgi:hypothetical protein